MPSIAEIAAAREKKAADRAAAKPASETPAKKPPAKKAPAAPAPAGPAPSVDLAAVPEARTVGKLSEVGANPLNPRRIDPNSPDMIELRKDLRERGQQTPVQVVTADHYRKIFKDTPHAAKAAKHDFMIVGGGRRRAALAANRSTTIKFNVLHGKDAPQDPAEWLAATGVENIQRESWSVMETARYIADIGAYSTGREVAALLNKSTSWVSWYRSLNDLPEDVQDVIESAPFSLRQARRVYDKKGAAARLREAQKIRADLLGEEAPADPAPAATTAGPTPADDTTEDTETTETTPNKGGRKPQTAEEKAVKAVRGIWDDLGRDALIHALRTVLDFNTLAVIADAITAHEPETTTDPAQEASDSPDPMETSL